ncbi:early endosome antigen 1-like isoform X2 [Corticium candelabrum]|uniref:early endosome antigen 1-like isoform X2 n=1 Tax=Corticium candelabrum TaxID=121492 RepID=UPI002E2624F4|nr:early endosome antigen 1-like isoform X2 [Corticium candelabrum]
MSGTICYSCQKKYKNCSCKTCQRCDTPFQTSLGLVKARSHCRKCNYAVCLHCYRPEVGDKICNVCRTEQKRAKLQLWHSITPSSEMKRLKLHLTQDIADPSEMATAAVASMSDNERKQYLLDSAREGNHHVMMTLLEAGTDINTSDSNGNSALFHAVENDRVACVALLMERKADIHIKNKEGWTSLHALARNGHSVECAELLIQMGVDIFDRSDEGSTAYDLAIQSQQSAELESYLAKQQVVVAVKQLKSHISDQKAGRLSEEDCIPTNLCTYIAALVEHYETHKEILFGTKAEATINNSRTPKPMEPPVVENDPTETITGHGKCSQQDSATGQETQQNDKGSHLGLFQDNAAKRIDRTTPTVEDGRVRELQQELEDLRAENEELEEQNQSLIGNVANANAEHHRERKRLQNQLREKDITLEKTEAKYKNCIAKIEKDTASVLQQMKQQLEEADVAKDDLLVLQQSLKLTWVPDRFVTQCANEKCVKPFTQTRRRHHCRCCGRVFCRTCTMRKALLPTLGYSRPVRVCNVCYALVDTLVSQTAITDRPIGESDESDFEDLSVEVAATFHNASNNSGH